MTSTDPACCLPTEVFLRVLEHLDVRALLQASLVSSTWNTLCADNDLWRALYRGHYGPVSILPPALSSTTCFRTRYACQFAHSSSAPTTPVVVVVVGALQSITEALKRAPAHHVILVQPDRVYSEVWWWGVGWRMVIV
jgi:F-box-like